MNKQLTPVWNGNEITKAKYNYTSTEFNLMMIIFKTVREKSGNEQNLYSFTFDEYLSYCKEKKINRQLIIQSIQSLQSKLFEWNNGLKWYSAPMINGVCIDAGASIIEFRIDYFIKNHLIDILKNTTRFFLESVFALKGKNSKKLYHHFSMWKSKQIYKIGFNDLKNLLYGNDETDFNKYESFSMFIKKVINPAITDINANTELFLNFEIEKKHKTESVFTFIINDKLNKKELEPDKQKIYEKLRSFGLVHWFIINVINTLTHEKINELIYQVTLMGAGLRNKGAYLRQIFINNGVPSNKV
jgi:plasmid replication initiation protein